MSNCSGLGCIAYEMRFANAGIITGFVGYILVLIAFISQIVSICWTKQSKDLSYITYIGQILCFACWTYFYFDFGLTRLQAVYYLPLINTVSCIVLSIITVCMKIYLEQCRKFPVIVELGIGSTEEIMI